MDTLKFEGRFEITVLLENNQLKRKHADQNRQNKYTVTWRRVRATIVAAEKQWVLHIPKVCVCVFIALGTQRKMRMRHIAICGLSDCYIFLHYLTNVKIKKKKKKIEHKIRVLTLFTTFVWNIFHST